MIINTELIVYTEFYILEIRVKKLMGKLKPIIITVIVCFIFMVAGYISQNIRYRQELKVKTESAYIKGKSEKMIENTNALIKDIDKSLTAFKKQVDDYNKQLNEVKEVSKNVSKKLENLSHNVNQLDNAFSQLHRLWANSD